jgi:hypothetical protein
MDFEKEAAAFRTAVRQAGRRGVGRRYPVGSEGAGSGISRSECLDLTQACRQYTRRIHPA